MIPCHNGARLTRHCIDSLLAQSRPPTHIVVVDNGSSDDTAELHRLEDRVEVLRLGENRGFAGGVNAGLEAARSSDEVLVVNNDTRAAPNLLDELHRALHASPDIGAVAPVSNHVKGEAHLPIGDVGRDDRQRAELAHELRAAPPFQDVDTLSGLCLLMRTSTIAEVGPFDERFGHGNFEDDDYSLRLRMRGYRLVLARRAFLHHEGHATFRALGLDLREQIERRAAQFRAKWRASAAGRATTANLLNRELEAASHAERALALTPRWPDAHWILGRFHERHGDATDAARHLEAFLHRCPEHVGAQVHLGLALLRTERQAEGQRRLASTTARHALTPALQLELLQRLARRDYEGGRFEAARQTFEQALEVAPDDADVLNWVGLCELALCETGLDRLAAAEARFAAAADRGHGLAHTNLGICQHRRGALDAARASFEKAVVLLPEDPVARRNYELVAGALAPTT